MTVSKLKLVVLAAVAGALLWGEHANRIKIEALTPAEAPARNSQVCPANESVPFSQECMAFIQGAFQPAELQRLDRADTSASASSSELP
jgi:hypothetical protein